MKLYTVWSGEYSDRGMHAIFQSKEKAEKYVEVHDKLNGSFYDNHYIIEYELEDDKFDINTEVNKYYMCNMEFVDLWNSDHSYQLCRKGEITTDEYWEDFMAEYNITDYDKLSKKGYEEIIEKYFTTLEDIYACEEDKYTSTELLADKRQTIVNYQYSPINGDQITGVTVYSLESYSVARKICIEKYQIFTQNQLEGMIE